MSFLKSIIVTFSFFTTIPMPMITWEQKYFRYVPFLLPVVGIVIGTIGYGLVSVLHYLEFSSFLSATLIVIYFVLITGGLHLDAVMDTCDAHFSRRDRARKLEIMKDSRVGAFAVVGLFCLLSLKIAVFNEIFFNPNIKVYVMFIPFISRTMQSLMLYLSPYALEEGIAALYKPVIKKYDIIIHFIYLMLASVVMFYLGANPLLFIFAAFVLFVYYRHFAIKEFGGITGDIIGAFLELTELVLLMVVLI